MAVASTADEVRLRQEDFYDAAETNRFEWLTEHPIIRRAEQALLAHLGSLEGTPKVMEVGCGEGANLATLVSSGKRIRYPGFDCFPAKVAFCRQRHAAGRFLVADARRPFPFRDGAYDVVLIRDILHHLAEPDRTHVLLESMRVLAPGGRLWIIEGNATNLLGRGFAMIFPHERCMLETRTPRLQGFVARTLPGHQIAEAMEEPSNMFRLLYHYQYGLPALGRTTAIAWVTRFWNKVSRAVRPSTRWAYSIIEVRKAGADAAMAGPR
jgi:ubiquinone/menaquinone biosynthesis C-methylase UbiE